MPSPATPPLTLEGTNRDPFVAPVAVATFPPKFLAVEAAKAKLKLRPRNKSGIKRKQDDTCSQSSATEDEACKEEKAEEKKRQKTAKGKYVRVKDPDALKLEVTLGLGESLRPDALKGRDLRNKDAFTAHENILRSQYFAKLRQRKVTRKKNSDLKTITDERDNLKDLNRKLMDELAQLRADDSAAGDNRFADLQSKYDNLCEVHAQLKRDYDSLKQKEKTEEVSQILADFPNSPRKNNPSKGRSRMIALRDSLRDSIENSSPAKHPLFGTELSLDDMTTSQLDQPLATIALNLDARLDSGERIDLQDATSEPLLSYNFY